MNLIQVQKGSKAFGSKVLFRDATFAVNVGEHVGVIGPNGAGKTTLFKILTGRESMDRGELVRAKDLRIGYLEQEAEWSPGQTIEEYLSDCIKPIWELKSLARGLGLNEGMFAKPVMSLSGGYRMRARLLHLLGDEPDIMLLDEPTNYLDLETLLVLERFLQGYRGAFLMISHDREFLRRTTDHTLEIEEQEVTKFPGNIDDYFEEKALLREQLEKQALSQAAKRQEILDFAARFGAKATKARQAQSRLKSLERMEQIEVRPLPVTARILIPEPERIGRKAISVVGADFGYDERTVLADVNLHLVRGDKIGVVGFNGAGKSTLLKALVRQIEPRAGQVEYGQEVRVGYYAQHVAEELDPGATVLEELQKAARRGVSLQQILDLAGSLLFSGDAIKKRVAKLSGGEKARVALGKILLMRVPVLVLDEVTNHLDFGTVEALTQALKQYQGTLVLVSHDRGFVGRVAQKIVEIRDGRVIEYPGTYDEYVWSLERGALAGEGDEASTVREAFARHASNSVAANAGVVKENYKEKRKQLDRSVRDCAKRIEAVEKEMEIRQARIESLSERLPGVSDPAERESVLKELGALPYEVMTLEEKWTELFSEKERLEAEVKRLVERGV